MSRCAPFRHVLALAVLALAAGGIPAASAQQDVPKYDTDNAFFAMPLEGFFPGQARGNQPKRLNVYLVRRDGKWVAGVGTATIGGRAVYNTALMPIDASGLIVDGDTIAGEMKVTIVPDPWIPPDQKVRHATVKLNAKLAPPNDPKTEKASITGTWSAKVGENEADAKAGDLLHEPKGTITGGLGGTAPNSVQDASYNLALYGLIPGQTTDNFQRRRAVSIGVKDGKAVSARIGQMDMRHNAYDYATLETPENVAVDGDTIKGSLTFTADTLDGEVASFTVTLEGRRVANWVVGTYTGKYANEDGKEVQITGYFRGDVRPGAFIPDVTARDDRPWFKEVANHQAVKPGEHPRLFFRKADVPELRRRAATPEGQAIVKRLRELLNGSDGETMPTSFNPATKAYEDNKFKATTGSYTISHAAGYGFLFQLTGDGKYADLARECIELAWNGQRNADDRYAWVAPGGELRAGPSLAWYAVAYDLCYDAWPEDFRVKVAQAIQNYTDEKGGEWNNPEGITLRKMILTPKQGPGSNHYGATIGGSGIAILAIKGDPGTDNELISKYMRALERQIVRHFMGGWGDGGYYKEGWGASRVGTQGGFLSLLQAMKTAEGKDFLNVERTNATNITMVPRSFLMLGPPGYFPYRSNMGPTYGNPEIGSGSQNNGWSHGGYFSEGFGAVADKHKGALLWTYNNVFSPDNKFNYDTLSPYPHRPMLALINWPTFAGIKEQDPDEVMPKAIRDTHYEFFAFRNRFQDKNDVVTSFLINQPDGTKPRDVMVWGMGGLRLNFGEPPRLTKVTHYAFAKDGSATIAAGGWALAVDHSGLSGADVLLLTNATNVKPLPAGKASTDQALIQTVKIGDATVSILTLSEKTKHPMAEAQGNTIKIGDQKATFADGKFTLENFTPVETPAK